MKNMADKFTKVSETEFTQEVAVAPSLNKHNLLSLKERRADVIARIAVLQTKIVELQTEITQVDALISKGVELGVKETVEVNEV